jgi:hypothetical protein
VTLREFGGRNAASPPLATAARLVVKMGDRLTISRTSLCARSDQQFEQRHAVRPRRSRRPPTARAGTPAIAASSDRGDAPQPMSFVATGRSHAACIIRRRNRGSSAWSIGKGRTRMRVRSLIMGMVAWTLAVVVPAAYSACIAHAAVQESGYAYEIHGSDEELQLDADADVAVHDRDGDRRPAVIGHGMTGQGWKGVVALVRQ